MGFYINDLPDKTPLAAKGKAAAILKGIDSAIETNSLQIALEALDNRQGVVVVIENGPFDAAAFAFSESEFIELTDPRDSRPKRLIIMDRKVAETLSGYQQ